ncbi:MAG: hypothetical protein KAS32_26070 [Candidatus Peribacteraceae bacterium]|nr:hypothetical protein [Candidatus Peribacteraceae bacterium]
MPSLLPHGLTKEQKAAINKQVADAIRIAGELPIRNEAEGILRFPSQNLAVQVNPDLGVLPLEPIERTAKSTLSPDVTRLKAALGPAKKPRAKIILNEQFLKQQGL